MLQDDNDLATTPTQRFSFEKIPYIEGGFGRFLRGRDNKLGRDITAKVFDDLMSLYSPSDQERFRREARIQARLSHPNIPRVHEVDFSDGRFLIISEFVEGTSLRQILDQQGPIHFSWASRWFDRIASALEHAHSLGTAHHDVTPGNIIVTPNRESAYLVNFGIALSEADKRYLTNSRARAGIPDSLSPHQDDPLSHSQSDLCCLGATMYEALSGKLAKQGQYEELSVANPVIPSETDTLLGACVESRGRCTESAKAFRRQLKAAVTAYRERTWFPEIGYSGRAAEAYGWREYRAHVEMNE